MLDITAYYSIRGQNFNKRFNKFTAIQNGYKNKINE